MVDIVSVDAGQEPDEDYVVSVEPESEDHHVVVEFDRRHARFVYGPRTFASRTEAVRTASEWADQYGIERVYVH